MKYKAGQVKWRMADKGPERVDVVEHVSETWPVGVRVHGATEATHGRYWNAVLTIDPSALADDPRDLYDREVSLAQSALDEARKRRHEYLEEVGEASTDDWRSDGPNGVYYLAAPEGDPRLALAFISEQDGEVALLDDRFRRISKHDSVLEAKGAYRG